MSQLLNIFLEPAKVFSELREKPSFWLPLLLSMASMAAVVLFYFMTVDSNWYLDHALLASGKEMSAAEIAQAKQVMPGTRVMGFFGAPSAALGIAIVSAITALYLMLAGKVTATAISFKQAFSLVCWANMPMLLGALIAFIGVLTMEPKTAIESLMLTNVDPLVMSLPVDHDWSKFAKGFNLLNFWVVYLMALGWRTWSKASWTQAVIVAALPSVVIYGCWALIVVLTS